TTEGAGEPTDTIEASQSTQTLFPEKTMSILEFYTVINESLAESKEARQFWETFESKLMSGLYLAAIEAAKQARETFAEIEAAKKLLGSGGGSGGNDTFVSQYNSAISYYNAGAV